LRSRGPRVGGPDPRSGSGPATARCGEVLPPGSSGDVGARGLRSIATLILALHLGGCYTLVPTTLPGLVPGDQVRVQVGGPLSAELRLFLGDESAAGTLSGAVDRRDADGLLLLLPSAYRPQGFHVETLHQRVRVPEMNVLRVDRRELDPGRTALAAGAVGLAVGAIAWQAISSRSGGNTAPNPDPGPAQSGWIQVR
jgi:hypothetical protein